MNAQASTGHKRALDGGMTLLSLSVCSSVSVSLSVCVLVRLPVSPTNACSIGTKHMHYGAFVWTCIKMSSVLSGSSVWISPPLSINTCSSLNCLKKYIPKIMLTNNYRSDVFVNVHVSVA